MSICGERLSEKIVVMVKHVAGLRFAMNFIME